MARSSTFTTYVRSELDPRTGTAYRQLETIANRTYDNIVRRASAANTASAQLAAGIGSGSTGAQAAAARAFDGAAQAAARAATAANDNARSQRAGGVALAEASGASAGLERNLATLATTLNVVQGPLGPLAGRIRSVSAAMTELTGLRFGVAAVGASLFVFTRIASEFTNVENRLRPLFETQQQFNQAFGNVIGIAQRSRQALEPVAELYSRLTIGGRDIGLSQARIGRLTELAAKAATLSGGAADVQQRGLVQFSQGIGRGILQGQDLKAVLEDIPILGKAIAAGFKNADGSIGTTIGNLRDLGAQGKLTGLAIADALERADNKVIEGPFAKLATTPAQGLTRIEIAIGQIIGNLNDATGATNKLGGALIFVADHLRTLISLGAGLSGAFIAPRLFGFFTDLTARIEGSIERAGQLRAIVGGTGNVTPVNAPQVVKDLGAARNAADDASSANQDAQVAVANTRARIAALDEERNAYRQGIATAREQLAAAEQASAATIAGTSAATDAILAEANATRTSISEIQQAAEADRAATAQRVADAEARVASLRVEAEQITANLALVDQQQAQATAAKATRANLNSQGLSFVGVGAADQAALDSANQTGRAQVLTRQQQTGVTLELAAAERELAAARIADTAAAEREAAADAAASVAQGSDDVVRQSTTLAAYRQRERAATAELAAANTALAEQEIVAASAAETSAAASAALTVAQRAATVATSVFGGALNLLKASVPFLVISGLVTIVTYLASAESQAARGARELSDAQQDLGKFVDTTTGKIIEQNKALLRGQLIKTQQAVADNRAGFQAAKEAFRQSGQSSVTSINRAGALVSRNTGIPDYISKLVDDVANNVKGSAAKLDTALTAFARTGTAAREAADRIRGAQATAVGALRNAQSAEATGRLLEGSGSAADARLAGGNFNAPGTPGHVAKPGLSAAQIKANADQVAANSDLQRAIAAREKVIADGAAAREQGTFDEKAYADQLTQATIAVNQAREAQKALNASRRDAARAATQAKRNESDVARDAAQQARDDAERTLQGKQQDLEADSPNISRQEYIDRRVANLQEYDNAINTANRNLAEELTRINGNRSASGKQAEESHKAATQQVADAKAVGAAQREIETAFQQQVGVAELKLQGRDNEAAALETTLGLVAKIGDAGYAEYQNLVSQNRVEELLNSRLAERQRITSALYSGVENVRQSLTEFLANISNDAPKAVQNLGKSLLSGFQRSASEILTSTLLDGADQKVKDLINGKSALESASDYTAVQFNRTGTAASSLADTLDRATAKINAVLARTADGTGATASAITGASGALDPSSDVLKIAVATGAAASAAAAANDNTPAGTNADGDVVVTGKRIDRNPAIAEPVLSVPFVNALAKLTNAKTSSKTPSLIDVYNATGRSIGDKLDHALGTKFLGNLGSKLGDVLGGAGKGTLASSLASAIGIKQNATGAAIGGAIGSFIPIPGASFITGIIGGLVGNLFSKPKYGSATIGVDANGQATAGAATGRGTQQIASALGDAKNVSDGINSALSQLNATITSLPGITIGSFEGKARVALTSTTKSLNYNNFNHDVLKDFGEGGEQAAIAYAIAYEVSHGVITGISRASQNIIASGQDLQTAIQKAVAIESIPKQLLQLTDPVKYAVSTLNDSFAKLISYLNEGQATAAQYADAQKLYDLQRAQALQQAANSSTQAITDFLNNLVGSSASPLNKKTAYENAQAALAGFATDINSGKAVDQNAFLEAAKNANDTSRAYNGSSSSYFSDFDALTALLDKARRNAGYTDAQVNTTDRTDLPASPFTTDPTAAAALASLTNSSNAAVNATNDQTDILSGKLDDILAALGGGGANDNSYGTIDLLPGFYQGKQLGNG